jgi:broad specificity phosphatase PhoE
MSTEPFLTVFFVRHGESRANGLRIHQPTTEPLSEKGLMQAQSIAKRAEHLPVDVFISSPYERARQTAACIADRLGMQPQEHPLFVEVRRPSELLGRPIHDPDVVAIKQSLMDHADDASWRYSDEETFFELKTRALNALAYLQTLGTQRVLVVTHGEFLVMLFAVIVNGEALSGKEFIAIKRALKHANTGLTECIYKDGRWRVITWNDQAHLGE